MTYTALPDEEPPTDQEKKEILEILRCLRVVRSHGGWGQITVWVRGTEVYEIQTAYTEKPKLKPPG
jgi:hypothetical protein